MPVRFRALLRAVASACLLLGCSLMLAQSPTDDVPVANPGRPTVSTPATLTPVGYLQFENGGLYATGSDDFSSRLGVNQVTKLTVASRLQFLALSEPLVYSRVSGSSDGRPGEVFAGLQTVALAGQGRVPTISFSYIRRLYESPAPEIDIGTFRQSALLLLSDDLLGLHLDVNGIVTEQAEDGIRRAQYGQTLSVSRPLKGVTISGELWHFTQPLMRGNAVGSLFAGSYSLRPNMVIDAGFNHGWTGSSTRWEGFAGFTYVLPHRLWGARATLSD